MRGHASEQVLQQQGKMVDREKKWDEPEREDLVLLRRVAVIRTKGHTEYLKWDFLECQWYWGIL